MRSKSSSYLQAKKFFTDRWFFSDYPGAEKRFQIILLLKDLMIYFGIPLLTLLLVKSCENSSTAKNKSILTKVSDLSKDEIKSQVIEFTSYKPSKTSSSSPIKRSPGTLIKIRLQNSVETHTTAPVHAQVLDYSLGKKFLGGIILGDATPDENFQKIMIDFKFIRNSHSESEAYRLNARALSLDGTLGINADKKEGLVARSFLGSSASGTQDIQKNIGNSQNSLQNFLLKALTTGLFQELGTQSQIERNRAQVLVLPPETVFFAELTDFFPGNQR